MRNMTGPKIKVLFVSHSAYIAGAEKCLFALVKNLDRERFEPVVVLPCNGPLKDKIGGLGVKTTVRHLVPWIYPFANVQADLGMMRRCEGLASLIEDEGIDIVHTNTSTIAEGAIAARLTDRPHVWHLHEILELYSTLKPLLPLYLTYRFIDLFSDYVVVGSTALEKTAGKTVRREKMRLIYNGVERPDVIKSKETLRRELGLPEGCHLVCTIGSIIKEKDHLNFVEAAVRVINARKDVYFIAAGAIEDFAVWKAVEEKIRKHSIGENVRFLGFRNDIGRILSEADVYVVPSETESFNLSAVEAMACSKPIAATRCGGPEEIVMDGETGLLVPVKDPDALAGAIISLIDEPAKRRQMGLAGKKRYEDLFSAGKYALEFQALYSGLKAGRKTSGTDEEFVNALMELVAPARKNSVVGYLIGFAVRRPGVYNIMMRLKHSRPVNRIRRLIRL